MGKFGGAFGLLPLTTSGYKLENIDGANTTQYTGSGGIDKGVFAMGYCVEA